MQPRLFVSCWNMDKSQPTELAHARAISRAASCCRHSGPERSTGLQGPGAQPQGPHTHPAQVPTLEAAWPRAQVRGGIRLGPGVEAEIGIALIRGIYLYTRILFGYKPFQVVLEEN